MANARYVSIRHGCQPIRNDNPHWAWDKAIYPTISIHLLKPSGAKWFCEISSVVLDAVICRILQCFNIINAVNHEPIYWPKWNHKILHYDIVALNDEHMRKACTKFNKYRHMEAYRLWNENIHIRTAIHNKQLSISICMDLQMHFIASSIILRSVTHFIRKHCPTMIHSNYVFTTGISFDCILEPLLFSHLHEGHLKLKQLI